MNPVEVILLFLTIASTFSFILYKIVHKMDDPRTIGEKNKKKLLPHCSCGCGNKIYTALGDIYDRSTNSWWTKDHYQKLLEGEIS